MNLDTLRRRYASLLRMSLCPNASENERRMAQMNMRRYEARVGKAELTVTVTEVHFCGALPTAFRASVLLLEA